MKALFELIGYLIMAVLGSIYFLVVLLIFSILYIIVVIISIFNPRFYYGKRKEKE
jgi:hypothetical protein